MNEILQGVTPAPWKIEGANKLLIGKTPEGKEIVPWMNSKDLEFIAWARNNIEALLEVLNEIVNPVSYMQQRAEESGHKIDGHMAIALASDPNYLQRIAKEALNKLNQEKMNESTNRW